MRLIDNQMSSLETAQLMSTCNGLIRLVSIISAFFFWFFVSLLVVVLALHYGKFSGIYSLLRGIGIFGLSPVALAFLTWRIVEFSFSMYLQKYVLEHTAIK